MLVVCVCVHFLAQLFASAPGLFIVCLFVSVATVVVVCLLVSGCLFMSALCNSVRFLNLGTNGW